MGGNSPRAPRTRKGAGGKEKRGAEINAQTDATSPRQEKERPQKDRGGDLCKDEKGMQLKAKKNTKLPPPPAPNTHPPTPPTTKPPPTPPHPQHPPPHPPPPKHPPNGREARESQFLKGEGRRNISSVSKSICDA